MILLLLFIPTLFQIIVGGKSKTKSITLDFGYVCLLSYLFQVVIGIGMVLYLATWNLHCGQPIAGLIMLNILFMIVITVVILMQYFRYKY